jgi:Kef-type K+ transport system membrane component KefB
MDGSSSSPPSSSSSSAATEGTATVTDALALSAFFSLIWVAEQLGLQAHVSPIVTNIAAGVLLGPSLADIVPYPDAFSLLGKLGVMIMVVGSGISVDLQQVLQLFGRAFAAALTGVVAPVLLSILVYHVGYDSSFETSLAVGAALAPTSLGFSAKMLAEAGELNTRDGNLICTAAVMDDVLSLLLLSEIQVLGKPGADWRDFALPAIGSISAVGVGLLLTYAIASYSDEVVRWLRRVDARLLPLADRHASEPEQGCKKPTIGDRLLLSFVLLSAALFAWLSSLVGSSDLLGCFFAGLAFSPILHCKQVWDRQMKQFVTWGGRLFFACAIGFSVPPLAGDDGLFNPTSLERGAVLAAVATLGKLTTGFFAVGELSLYSFLKVGWAMNGRGEFSALIADEAFSEDIFTPVDYSAVIWGFLVPSIFSPAVFRYLLTKQVAVTSAREASGHSEEVHQPF